MKRKYPLKNTSQEAPQRHGNTANSKGAARRERNRQFREQLASDMKSRRISRLIFLFLERFIFPLFGAHWVCLLFWPSLGLTLASFPGYPDLSTPLPLLATLVGGGIGLLFFTWQRRSPYLIMAGYGAIAGFLFGGITGTLTDAMQDAFIGMLLGFASPFLATILLKYY